MEIFDYFTVEHGMEYSLKTISIGFSGGDLIFEGLGAASTSSGQAVSFNQTGYSAIGFLALTLKDQITGNSVEFFLRYRLEGTVHTAFSI